MKTIKVIETPLSASEKEELILPFRFASNIDNFAIGEQLPRDCKNIQEAFKSLLDEYSLKIKDVLYEDVYVYMHGCIKFSIAPFSGCWDSGIGGYLWVEKKEYLKSKGRKRMSQKLYKEFKEEVREAIKVLNSQLYRVEIYENGEFVDEVELLLEVADEYEIAKLLRELEVIKPDEKFEIKIE